VDAAAIAAIYNEGIEDRIATFETEPRTVEQIAAQLIERGDGFPTVVVECDGRVIAWAGQVRMRAGRCTRELRSIRCMWRGRRVGAAPGGQRWRRCVACTESAASGN
jgi:phosphinothricin acetyltransferase